MSNTEWEYPFEINGDLNTRGRVCSLHRGFLEQMFHFHTEAAYLYSSSSLFNGEVYDLDETRWTKTYLQPVV